jgi:hypothetical protein
MGAGLIEGILTCGISRPPDAPARPLILEDKCSRAYRS